MPEPLLYLKAMAAAAVVSVLVMLAAAPLRCRSGGFSRLSVLALAAGLAAGYVVLSPPVGWPPANALARWLTIVLPLVLLIELFAQAGSGVAWLPNWIPWTLRVVLALAIPRILLHGSVYLSGPEYGWSVVQAAVVMLLCGTSLLLVWGLLMRLANRAAPASVVATLVLTILTAGIAIMLAGYLGGGAAALPLAACLLASSLTHRMLLRRRADGPAAAENSAALEQLPPIENRPVVDHPPLAANPPAANAWLNAGGRAILSVAVVGLVGLLFVGHFFGRLSIHNAVVLGLTPLLGWVTELPGFRNGSPRTRAVLRIALVAVPLAILLGFAKQKFDRELAPLM